MAKGIRRVRSTEGMRKYNLPIGAPITADAIKKSQKGGGGSDRKVTQRKSSSPEAQRETRSDVQNAVRSPRGSRGNKISTTPRQLQEDTTVKSGALSYTVPSGYTAFQPEGRNFTVVVSPGEDVSLLTPNGVVELDGEASEAVLDVAFPDTIPVDRQKADTPSGPAPSPESEVPTEPRERQVSGPTSLGELEEDYKPTLEETDGLLSSPFTAPHIDPATGYYSEERQAFHREVVARMLEGIQPSRKPVVYFNGGGPAAGKGTMTKGANARLTNYPTSRGADEFTGELEAIDNPQALLIDPDIMKMQLPEAQAAVQRLQAGTPEAGDADWANYAHNESSDLSAQLYRAALDRGVSVIFDGTGNGSVASVRSKVANAKEKGYTVEANYVFLDPNEGRKRAVARAESSHRIVPEKAIVNTYANIPNIFDELKDDGTFDKVQLFDNNVPRGQLARRIGSGDGSSFTISDPVAYAGFMATAPEAARLRDILEFKDSDRRSPLRSTEAGRMADALLTQADQIEPDITTAVESLAEEFGLSLEGLEYRRKSAESLARKLSTKAGKNKSILDAGAEIRDVVRYTMLSSDESSYVDQMDKVLTSFNKLEYSYNIKNYWADNDNPYQGVNVSVATKEGFPFEMQFHTRSSFDTKMGEMHTLYEKQRAFPDESVEADLYRQLMKKLSQGIPVPQKITDWDFVPLADEDLL